MLLASKDGKLIRATPDIYAICPFCKEDVIPRCGSIRIWHWAHKVGECIYYSEPETDWHLEWKERALKFGLEIEKRFDDHIADIYDSGTNTVIEVQHSPISEEKMTERISHYRVKNINLTWIFDKTKKFDQGNLIIGIEPFEGLDFEYRVYEEKWYNRYPDEIEYCDISYHFKNNDNVPVLLRIHQFHYGKNFDGFGIIYQFRDFNSSLFKQQLNEIYRLKRTQREIELYKLKKENAKLAEKKAKLDEELYKLKGEKEKIAEKKAKLIEKGQPRWEESCEIVRLEEVIRQKIEQIEEKLYKIEIKMEKIAGIIAKLNKFGLGLTTWEKEIIQKIELKKAEIYNLERESSQRKAKEIELRKDIQGKLQEIKEWISGEEYILSEKIDIIDNYLIFKTEDGLVKYNNKDGHHKNIGQINELLDKGVRFKFRLNALFGGKFYEFTGNQL